MAAALYDKGRDAFANGGINWASDTIKVALVGSGYTADMANDQYFSTITGVIGTPSALTGKSSSAGVVNASNVTTGTIATGSTITQLVLFKDTGTASTSPLIARMDVTSTPTNGGTITVSWDTGANKIFKL